MGAPTSLGSKILEQWSQSRLKIHEDYMARRCLMYSHDSSVGAGKRWGPATEHVAALVCGGSGYGWTAKNAVRYELTQASETLRGSESVNGGDSSFESVRATRSAILWGPDGSLASGCPRLCFSRRSTHSRAKRENNGRYAECATGDVHPTLLGDPLDRLPSTGFLLLEQMPLPQDKRVLSSLWNRLTFPGCRFHSRNGKDMSTERRGSPVKTCWTTDVARSRRSLRLLCPWRLQARRARCIQETRRRFATPIRQI